jgi:PTH2 family peptidyl-tRNA hydrolase
MSDDISQLPDPDYRMMLVVRHDLNMRRGKLGAQTGHAAEGVFTRHPDAVIRQREDGTRELVVPLDEDTYGWLQANYKKVCVSVPSDAALVELHEQARAAGVRCSLVEDHGLTEFGGKLTRTVLVLGPHAKARLDPLTGHLPTY